jgi:hypothetical protein
LKKQWERLTKTPIINIIVLRTRFHGWGIRSNLMKQGSFRAVCFVLLTCTAIFSAYGDESTVNSEAVVIESFDGSTTHEWTIKGRSNTYEFEWRLDASKFASKNGDDVYPKLTSVPAWPQALFGSNRQGSDYNSLGIWGRFDRRGYNWIDVYPVEPGGETPFEVPLPGRVQYLDMWVWGSNLQFYVEAFVRDFQGVVHTLRFGDISYTGWKNLRVQVPTAIRQSKRILPHYAGLQFVKFRIWTQPSENVSDFYVYFDHFKIVTDTFESFYDGDELADPDRVQELWTGTANN